MNKKIAQRFASFLADLTKQHKISWMKFGPRSEYAAELECSKTTQGSYPAGIYVTTKKVIITIARVDGGYYFAVDDIHETFPDCPENQQIANLYEIARPYGDETAKALAEFVESLKS